jgi:hypothetical protein
MLHDEGVVHDARRRKTISNIKTHNPLLMELCKKVKFDDIYDTPQVKSLGYPAKINNIFDAFMALKELIQNPFFTAANTTAHAGMQQLGEMHIYQDRPLEYISSI